MFKRITLSIVIIFGFLSAALAENISTTKAAQFEKAYKCFIEKYREDESLIQSFIEYEPNKKQLTYKESVNKYGKEKYDKSINALVNYYFECQERYSVSHSQS